MANKPTCYFCQQVIKERAEEFLCSGCLVYICDSDVYGCGSRTSPWCRPNHNPETHKMPCGTCGEGGCDCVCRTCGEEGCDLDTHRAEDCGFEDLPVQRPMLSVKDVEKAVKAKAKDWNGRCYEIAKKLSDSGLVKGEVRYGIYWGHISDESTKFAGRSFSHHGWIELPDRTIVDPTRWAFEARNPYIWEGWNSGIYDVGGSKLYAADPLPAVKDSEEAVPLKLGKAKAFVDELLQKPPRITKNLAIWLAHRSPDALGSMAKPIYQAVVDAGLGAYLQYDMRVAVLGKGG